MLDLYNTYADEEAKQDDIYLEQVEIAMEKAMLAVETCDKLAEFGMREAEIRCIQEDGDGTDLIGFYEEAKEETDAKREGLIQKAWAAICKFFKSIKEKLFGKAEDKIDEKATYEVNQNDIKDMNLIQKAWNNVKGFSKHPIKSSITIVVSAIALLGGLTILKKGGDVVTKKITGKDLKGLISSLKKTNDELEKDSEGKAKNPKKAGDKESEGKLREFFKKISSPLRELISNFINARKVAYYDKKYARAEKKNNNVENLKYKNRADATSAFGGKEYEDYQRKHTGNGSFEAKGVDLDDFEDSADDSALSFDELMNLDTYQESAEDMEIAMLLDTL